MLIAKVPRFYRAPDDLLHQTNSIKFFLELELSQSGSNSTKFPRAVPNKVTEYTKRNKGSVQSQSLFCDKI
jgi:hypothetical protein